MSGPSLRPHKPFFERVKLPLILLVYIAVSEWADPFPFHATLPARLAVFVLVLFVVREFHHARLEIDADWARRTGEISQRLREHGSRISRRTWLKVQRVTAWALGVYAFGMMLNTLTTRCDSAPQCAVLAPRMAVENLPTFIQFAVMVTLTLFQLAIMFWAMIKVGSYKIVMPGTMSVTFDDVWGQDQAKQRVMEQVKLLEDSERIEAAGGHMPKGLLLYGPPGTGKTYLAKAAANYSSKPLILVPPGAFQATFVGIDLLKVWTLFRTIRKLARRYSGVIVFLDEIDSLGNRGGGISNLRRARSYYRHFISGADRGWETESISEDARADVGCVRFVAPRPSQPREIMMTGYQSGALQAFLSAMDGMEEPRGLLNRMLVFLGFKPLRPYEYKYLMIGATNRESALDEALLRAGRFGRKIHVTYPKVEGRRKTYEGYLAKITNNLTPENVEWAARNHEKGTGADIEDIINEALLITFRSDREDQGVVGFDDLVRAMVWVTFGESDGPFERESGRWQVAVHEAGHAVAFHFLCRERQHIWFASIEQRRGAGGMVMPTQLHEDWLLTHEEMMSELQVGLASRVAETLLLGTTTNGHGSDGRQITALAEDMVQRGHADMIGMYDRSTKDVRNQAEKLLHEALASCQTLLTEQKDGVEAVAQLLYERGTVPGDEIHALLDGPGKNN